MVGSILQVIGWKINTNKNKKLFTLLLACEINKIPQNIFCSFEVYCLKLTANSVVTNFISDLQWQNNEIVYTDWKCLMSRFLFRQHYRTCTGQKEFSFHCTVYNIVYCYVCNVCIFCSFSSISSIFFFFAVFLVSHCVTFSVLFLPSLIQQVLHTALAFLFPLQFDSDAPWNPVIFVYFNEIRSLFALRWCFHQSTESVHQEKHHCIQRKERAWGHV